MKSADIDRALAGRPEAAVAALLAGSENQWYERKSGRVGAAELAKPLVAMANSEGGTVVVGLFDGRVDAVSDQAANDLRQTAFDFTRPAVRMRVDELLTDSGRVLVFRIPPGEVVHETNKGECYQRVGDESRRLSFAQRQELEWDRALASFDGTPVRGLDISDLDQGAVERFRTLLGAASVTSALAARDLTPRAGGVSVAATLLLGARPQREFPNAHVRVLRYAEPHRGEGRLQNLEDGGDVRCEGTIPQQLEQAIEAIERLIPRRRALGDSGRFGGHPIIPRDAWLEGVVNALVHRSYSIAGDHIRVELFPNRVEITSPGRFPGIADPSNAESIGRFARNPRIARVCADLGITQELGEGIRRIFAEMRRVGLSDPIYVQGTEAVRLTLPASAAIPGDTQAAIGQTGMRILDILREMQRPLGTGQIVELLGLARPTVLRHLDTLRDADLVIWEGGSRNDPRATWRLP